MANFIDLPFADGVYRFALPLAQIAELQRKCDAGIGEIFARVLRGAHQQGGQILLAPSDAQFYVLDLIETVRHGLIGGKGGTVNEQPVRVTPPDATRLIDTYLLDQPLMVAWELAVAILGALIIGYEAPEPEGNGQAAAEKTPSKDPAA